MDKTDQRVFFTSVQTQSPANKLPRWTSSSSPALFSSSQSSLPGYYSATKSLGTRSTYTPTTGTPPTKRQQETKTTLSSSAKERPEGNTKPLQRRFISECQIITKISKKNNENEENARETAKDPDFDEYQDKEGKNKDEENKDDENKTKLNKTADTCASQFTDWSAQLTILNASRSEHLLIRNWKDGQ